MIELAIIIGLTCLVVEAEISSNPRIYPNIKTRHIHAILGAIYFVVYGITLT